MGALTHEPETVAPRYDLIQTRSNPFKRFKQI
jgi:hypothetical protein